MVKDKAYFAESKAIAHLMHRELDEDLIKDMFVVGKALMASLGYEVRDYVKLEIVYEKNKQAGTYTWGEHILRMNMLIAVARGIAPTFNTMMHELVHAVTPRGTGHGYMFKSISNVIRNNTGIDITRTWHAREAENLFPYRMYCTSCGEFLTGGFKYTKVFKHPEFYHCRKCGGNVRVEVNKC